MRSQPKKPIFLAAIFAVCALASAQDYALQHVRIVNPGKPVIEDGMIAISGGKIVYVGESKEPDTNFGVVDCKGLTAYPGFIDAYTRAGLNLPAAPTPADPPSAFDGPLASMWHENRRGIYADLDASAYIDAKTLNSRHSQGVTCAQLASGRGAFGGLTVIVNTFESDPAPILMRSAFQELGFAGGGGGGYPGSPMARIALMRQMLFDSEYQIAHPGQDGEKDMNLSAIGDITTGLVRTLFRADTEREIQRAFNLADEFGLKLTIFGTDSAWEHAAELKRREVPVIVQAAFPREPRLDQSEDPVRRLNDPPLEYLKEQHDIWMDQCLAVVKLQKGGAQFAFSSDGDTDIFLANVRRHIQLGLPKDAALAALTSDAAMILGVADKVGTIENGKVASLVLFDGDFAAETSKIKMVFVAGKKFDLGGN